MNAAPEWFYRLDGFIYAENYEELEVIANECDFFEWVVDQYDLNREKELDLWYLFWLDYGTKEFYQEFYNHLNQKLCKHL